MVGDEQRPGGVDGGVGDAQQQRRHDDHGEARREGEDPERDRAEQGAGGDDRQGAEATAQPAPEADGEGGAAVADEPGEGDVVQAEGQAVDVDHGDERGCGHDAGAEEQLRAGHAPDRGYAHDRPQRTPGAEGLARIDTRDLHAPDREAADSPDAGHDRDHRHPA